MVGVAVLAGGVAITVGVPAMGAVICWVVAVVAEFATVRLGGGGTGGTRGGGGGGLGGRWDSDIR